jgi:hypothetical protein
MWNLPHSDTQIHELLRRVANGYLGKFRALGHKIEGKPTDGYFIVMGLLSGDDLVTYMQQNPDYVVSSYDTPIAWYSQDHGWHVPDTHYSYDMTFHQQLIKTGVQS